jgi:hypothetical protein
MGGLSRRLLDCALTGAVGAALYRAGAAVVPRVQPAARRVAVGTLALGIAWSRRLETLTEEARLSAGDLVAEARRKLGEEASPPAAHPGAGGDGHEH